MKVYYKTEYRPSDFREYTCREVSTEFCCSLMKKAWEGDAVMFGEPDSFGWSHQVTISHCSPYPEGACWDTYAIGFCPFCGKPIELIEKERINFRKKIVQKQREEEVWEVEEK